MLKKATVLLPLVYLSLVFLLAIGTADNFERVEFSPLVNNTVFNEVLEEFVDSLGLVEYSQVDKKGKLQNYLSMISAINPFANNWEEDDEKAYWINVYNALVLKKISSHYPISSIKDIKNVWNETGIKIGGTYYSLSDIEHKYLRKIKDPKIHFALVCGAISCPRLKSVAYQPDLLDQQLYSATAEFINNPRKNIITADAVQLSSIFKWFKSDFSSKGTLINFINQFSHIKVKKNADISFLKYNWNINARKF